MPNVEHSFVLYALLLEPGGCLRAHITLFELVEPEKKKSNNLAILDSTAAHGQPLLVPLPLLPPFQPAAFNCGTSALTTRGLTVPDMQLVKDHVQTEG